MIPVLSEAVECSPTSVFQAHSIAPCLLDPRVCAAAVEALEFLEGALPGFDAIHDFIPIRINALHGEAFTCKHICSS